MVEAALCLVAGRSVLEVPIPGDESDECVPCPLNTHLLGVDCLPCPKHSVAVFTLLVRIFFPPFFSLAKKFEFLLFLPFCVNSTSGRGGVRAS